MEEGREDEIKKAKVEIQAAIKKEFIGCLNTNLNIFKDEITTLRFNQINIEKEGMA